MAKKDQSSSQELTTTQPGAVEIPSSLPMGLHALDLARHTVIAPDGKRFVVATFDDTRLGRGYVTGVYPQQNEYLTLVRLPISEVSHATPEEALQHHVAVTQAIQRGKLNEFLKSSR
jgi:hypothetical protein